MDWASRRKILYAFGFVSVIMLLTAYPAYLLVREEPTCFDAKQNGTETGLDCGGGCALVCTVEAKPPRVVWAKAFSIGGGLYDVGAYVENINTRAGLRRMGYTLRVLGLNASVLVEKKGAIELPPESRVLLFETGVVLVEAPTHVEVLFDADDLKKWTRATTAPSPVVNKNQSLKNVDTKPRFDAVMVNTDPVNEVQDLSLGAIVYDPLRSPVAVSTTYVRSIPKGGEQNIFFTWPSRFTKHGTGEKCVIPVDTMLISAPKSESIAREYVDLIDSSNKIGLISIGESTESSTAVPLSVDRSKALEVLSNVKPLLRGFNLGEALARGYEELQKEGALGVGRALVLITDGNTTLPVDSKAPKSKQFAEDFAAQKAEEIRKSGINIYTIGTGKTVNEIFLKDRIAGGGAYYFATSTPEILQNIYQNSSEAVCPAENFITEIVVTPRAIFSE